MCIAALTTAHPDYALVLINNRDEYILRPTSRPHWWSTSPSSPPILASRDLFRPECGTWLGLTRDGRIAVLTNFDNRPAAHVHSRGRIVTNWLEGKGCEGVEPAPGATTKDQVRGIVETGLLGEYPGFNMICGRLRRRPTLPGEGRDIEPLAVISNRTQAATPWICAQRGETHALSNTSYHDPDCWLKIAEVRRLLAETIADAAARALDEEGLAAALFAVLDTDRMTPFLAETGVAPEEMKPVPYPTGLRRTIFVPPLGRPAAKVEAGAREAGAEPGREGGSGGDGGVYGTQRQTLVMVRWDGEVVLRERSLWDPEGRPIERGIGDVVERFTIDGWGATM